MNNQTFTEKVGEIVQKHLNTSITERRFFRDMTGGLGMTGDGFETSQLLECIKELGGLYDEVGAERGRKEAVKDLQDLFGITELTKKVNKLS